MTRDCGRMLGWRWNHGDPETMREWDCALPPPPLPRACLRMHVSSLRDGYSRRYDDVGRDHGDLRSHGVDGGPGGRWGHSGGWHHGGCLSL